MTYTTPLERLEILGASVDAMPLITKKVFMVYANVKNCFNNHINCLSEQGQQEHYYNLELNQILYN